MSNGHVQSLARTFHTQFGSVDDVVEWLTDPKRKRAIREVRINKVGLKSTELSRRVYAKDKSIKINVVGEGFHTTLLTTFLSQLRSKRVVIVERPRSMIGLSSFYCRYNSKSGLTGVDAKDPSNVALAYAHVNATLFGKELADLKKWNQFGTLAVLGREGDDVG